MKQLAAYFGTAILCIILQGLPFVRLFGVKPNFLLIVSVTALAFLRRAPVEYALLLLVSGIGLEFGGVGREETIAFLLLCFALYAIYRFLPGKQAVNHVALIIAATLLYLVFIDWRFVAQAPATAALETVYNTSIAAALFALWRMFGEYGEGKRIIV